MKVDEEGARNGDVASLISQIRSETAVLIADDDEQVLWTIENQLKRLDVDIVLARDGEEAQRLLGERHFAVVLADEGMPKMSGTQLLSWLRGQYPEVARILITGNVDFETALHAINTGEVFRFITKPWTGDHLRAAVIAGLERHDLREQNRLLLDQLQQQNAELADLNASLQDRVEQATSQLAGALDNLADTFDGTLQLISALMGIGEPQITDHCQRTRTHVRRVAEELGLSEPWIVHLDLAALCHWIGLINAPSSLFRTPIAALDRDQAAVWEFHPAIGSMILSTVPALEIPSQIIAGYLEQPSHDVFVKSPELWTARQVLKAASSFERVRTVTQGNAETTWGKALKHMESQRRREISSDVLDVFLEQLPPVGSVAMRKVHAVDELHSGMVLKRTITTGNDIPVAPEGTMVTHDLLRRLKAFEATTGISEIWVSA